MFTLRRVLSDNLSFSVELNGNSWFDDIRSRNRFTCEIISSRNIESTDWVRVQLLISDHHKNTTLLILITLKSKISSIKNIRYLRCGFYDQSTRKTETIKKYQLIVKQRDSIVSYGAMNNEICIYLPHFHYRKPLIETTFGSCERIDKTSQLLIWDCSAIRAEDLKREVVLTIENSVHWTS